MKTLYIECKMGAAGDMLTSALFDLIDDKPRMLKKMNAIGLEGVHTHIEPSESCGIHGYHTSVHIHGHVEGDEHVHAHHHHHHDHHSLADIQHIIEHLQVSDQVKIDAFAIYTLIAQAESHVHECPIDHIHFHEVGTLDAIADVVHVCLLMEAIAPDQVIISPICTGSGTVRCAHGILPVPAPATAYLLKGMPMYEGKIETELCTPTGAALLKYFATDFGQMPIMDVSKIGYGMGTKQFDQVNCVRIFLGQEEHKDESASIVELACNIDDMSGEELGYAMDRLLEKGARDVFFTPIQMKKSRPGILLSVLCDYDSKETMIKELFKQTSTIGIREKQYERHILKREIHLEETPLGKIHKKRAEGFGSVKEKWEYEDLVQLANTLSLSLDELKKKLK